LQLFYKIQSIKSERNTSLSSHACVFDNSEQPGVVAIESRAACGCGADEPGAAAGGAVREEAGAWRRSSRQTDERKQSGTVALLKARGGGAEQPAKRRFSNAEQTFQNSFSTQFYAPQTKISSRRKRFRWVAGDSPHYLVFFISTVSKSVVACHPAK
jgi:hypothetical protein